MASATMPPGSSGMSVNGVRPGQGPTYGPYSAALTLWAGGRYGPVEGTWPSRCLRNARARSFGGGSAATRAMGKPRRVLPRCTTLLGRRLDLANQDSRPDRR